MMVGGQARENLRRMLLTEWTLVYGDVEFVKRRLGVTDDCEDGDYAVYWGSYRQGNETRRGHLHLARKTASLRAFLANSDRSITDEEFERLVSIHVRELPFGFAAVQMSFVKDPAAENIVRALDRMGL